MLFDLLWKIHLPCWKAVLVFWICCWINSFLTDSMAQIACSVLVRIIVDSIIFTDCSCEQLYRLHQLILWLSQIVT